MSSGGPSFCLASGPPTLNPLLLAGIRDESSFHNITLLVFRFELIKNVLEFLFQNLKIGNCFEIPHFVVNYALCACAYETFSCSKLGTCASFCSGRMGTRASFYNHCSERSALFF